MTSCIECQLDMHAPRAAVPLCTLATIPRQPQHCIEWAHIIAWEEERKDITLDTDDPEHITWLYQSSSSRARIQHPRRYVLDDSGVVKISSQPSHQQTQSSPLAVAMKHSRSRQAATRT
jgi:hypothetical protein